MIRPAQKDLYAVIGNPVDHSLSPVMMNAVFEALKIPAVYLALQVDDLAEDLATLAKLGVRGLSVTIPHKEPAYRLAVNVDEPSQAMGAVNTLRLQGTRWEGYNTDWIGAITALRYAINRISTCSHSVAPLPDSGNPIAQADTPTHHSSLISRHSLRGKHALIIGAGGVARAVVYGLKREGALITVSNRGIERGEALARAFDCAFVPLSELPHAKGKTAFDIIVQCTPLGLMHKEDPAPLLDALLPRAQDPTAKSQPPRAKRQEPRADFTLIPDSFFRPGTVVMDTVYRPLWTPFLRKAQAAGCVVISGAEMLLHQGVAQLQWWFGDLIRPEVVLPIMRQALMGILEDE
jgi:shikimate dehydrogenase